IADDLSPEAKTILERIPEAQVDVRIGLKPAELREIAGAYDALAVRSATKVTAELLAAATRLRVIGRAGTGVDNIDLDAATRRGVVVMNAPGGNSVSVAEHTVALLLALARQVADAPQSTRAGKWEKKKFAAGRELLGKTLGVVGTGSIGALVVQRAKAFGMKVITYDPFLSEEAAAKLGVELVPLAEIFRRSDAVTLHVPLNEQTKNMVAAPQLAQMKPGALLINCARGGLIDEMALAEALESTRLGRAAQDVFATQAACGAPEQIEIAYAGEVAQHPSAPLTAAVLKGVLGTFLAEPVNEVSAPALARDRGLSVQEMKTSDTPDFASLITVRLRC